MMRYWFKNCPRCRQGRLFIMRMNETGKVYLHCEECEWSWADPTQSDDPKQGKLGIDFDSEYASEKEIDDQGWRTYAAHSSVE